MYSVSKKYFRPAVPRFCNLNKLQKRPYLTRRGPFAPCTHPPLLCCGGFYHSFLTVSIKELPRVKRGEIRKQAKTLISSRFKDSGQTGYK